MVVFVKYVSVWSKTSTICEGESAEMFCVNLYPDSDWNIDKASHRSAVCKSFHVLSETILKYTFSDW